MEKYQAIGLGILALRETVKETAALAKMLDMHGIDNASTREASKSHAEALEAIVILRDYYEHEILPLER